MKASFTYEVITEESATNGEAAEHGWILPGYWEFPLQDSEGYHDNILADARSGEFDCTDLREVVGFAQELGIGRSEGADWLYSDDPDHGDYTTDEQRFYSLHLGGVTDSSRRRILRLILLATSSGEVFSMKLAPPQAVQAMARCRITV